MFPSCILLLSVVGIHGSTVTIETQNKIINTTDERFVSWTIDTSQFMQNTIDLTDSRMIYLATQLSPAFLRCGGTEADYLYYNTGHGCDLPSDDYHCLAMSKFNSLVSFASEVGVDLVFGLSFGYPEFPTSSTTSWNSSDTERFLNYLHNIKHYTSDDIFGFELGNELNLNLPFSVEQHYVQSNAFATLRGLINKIWEDESDDDKDFKLLGCDSHSPSLRDSYEKGFGYLVQFINGACNQDAIDGFTYHSYVNQDQTEILTPNGINEQYKESSRVSNIFSNTSICGENRNGRKRVEDFIWAGEIAEHNQGGIDGLTNAFYDGFWYLDALGSLAKIGQKVFARQTFAKSKYGLLNYGYTPNPDYYTAILFSQLMGTNVLGVSSNNDNVRIYAHCARDSSSMCMSSNETSTTSQTQNSDRIKKKDRKRNNIIGLGSTTNGVAMAYVNIDSSSLNLKFDKSDLGETVYLWILTTDSSSGDLSSTSMKLNGEKLELDSNGVLPSMKGKEQTGKDEINVPGHSYGFFLFTSTKIDVCS